MTIRVLVHDSFKKSAKRFAKKYPSFPSDLLKLITDLESAPDLGTPLGADLRKIRVAVKSKGKGKRGGFRIITLFRKQHGVVHLLTIYDKSEVGNIADAELKTLVSELYRED